MLKRGLKKGLRVLEGEVSGVLLGGFEGFCGILHNDMGGNSAFPIYRSPPRGGSCAPLDPPLFLKKNENAPSPLSAVLGPLLLLTVSGCRPRPTTNMSFSNLCNNEHAGELEF